MISTFLSIFASFLFFPTLFQPVQAAPLGDILGYAWSPNAGWISMNCINTSCSSTNYGVTVSGSSLSGYAWSSVLGWISFNVADLAGCPIAPCTNSISLTTGIVSGWARVLSAGGVESGGWEGWIKLRGSNYGLLINGTKLTGNAWGGGQVTGTGVFSPKVGGNAVAGWVSFRGLTPLDQSSRFYGASIATSSAVTPVTISCGVSAAQSPLSSTVTWTVKVDAAKTGTVNSYDWHLDDAIIQSTTETTVSGISTSQLVVKYPVGGLKSGAITVTAGGAPYVVDCDAAALTALGVTPSPWYPNVLVGSLNLVSLTAPDAPTPVAPAPQLMAGWSSAYFSGPNTNVTCNVGDIVEQKNCDYAITTPFNNIVQVVMSEIGPPADLATTDGYLITTLPTINHIEPGETVPVTATWPIPVGACPYVDLATKDVPCQAYARVCADYIPSNVPDVGIPRGVICEYGDTGVAPNCSSTHVDNCTVMNDGVGLVYWQPFIIEREPPPPPTVGFCKGTPGVTTLGKPITWIIDPTSVIDGEPPFTYKWESTTAGAENDLPVGVLTGGYGTDTFASKTYTTGGTKTAKVTVKDALERTLVRECAGKVRFQIVDEF